MNAPVMNECIPDETLAQFVEGKLTGRERDELIEHIASCGECRERLNDASEVVQMLSAEDETKNVAEFPTGKPWGLWLGGLAAAAVVAAVMLGPMRKSIWDEPAIPKLVEASKSLKERKLYGRPLGGFPYKDINRVRGDEKLPEAGELELLKIRGEMLNASRVDHHAFGVLALLEGKTGEAIKHFETALVKQPEKREVIEQDLAVALIERRDEKKHDLERALEITTTGLAKKRTPEVAWNRALVLEALDQDARAIAAWDDYLRIDPDSAWAMEAEQKRNALQLRIKQPHKP